jgi:hypothetical protein
MGIKEKDLEGLILQLFDTSPEIQNKIRNICGISHRETEISNESACVRNTVDKRNNFDVDTSRLNAEIIKYKKVSTFDLPEDTIIILLANNLEKNKLNEEIYSLVAHI